MKFQIDRAKYIDSGLVSERHHPSFPLLIYNYTPIVQYSKAWDEVTMMCRGLIVTETGHIVARPFPKFFNYEEHVGEGRSIPNEEPYVYEKMDGSLGIIYWWDGKPYVATRGSFESPQAKWASRFIELSQDGVYHNPDLTELVEIIYPDNRIVVDYHGYTGLVHLGFVDKETGRSVNTRTTFPSSRAFPFSSVEELAALNTKGEEGFVLHYPKSDLRLKIKFEDYKRLHKLYTGLNSIAVWEWLRDGVDPYAQDVPDEMLPWLKGVVDGLNNQFNKIEAQAISDLHPALCIKRNPDPREHRKEQAAIISKAKYPGITFQMLDDKNYGIAIWRMIRPKGADVFRTDIDA